MIPSDLLRKAADVIEEVGWTQCATVDADRGGLCLDGALRVANNVIAREQDENGAWVTNSVTQDMPAWFKRYTEVERAHKVVAAYLVEKGVETPFNPILPKGIVFNDKVAETVTDVTGALRGAADWIENHPELAELSVSEDSTVSA